MAGHELGALLLWLAILVFAFVYTQRTRHPRMKPLAAFLIFALAFTAIAGGLFWLSAYVIATAAGPQALANTWVAAAVGIAAFAPALAIASYLIRREPNPPPPPQ